jgi:hypothetical protein
VSNRGHYPGEENQLVEWAVAIRDGVRDTFRAMLMTGRSEARQAETEAWQRFDEKTRFRRRKPND